MVAGEGKVILGAIIAGGVRDEGVDQGGGAVGVADGTIAAVVLKGAVDQCQGAAGAAVNACPA